MIGSIAESFHEASRTLEAIWTVPNFLDYEQKTFIESEHFNGPAPFDLFRWKLRVYPIGKSFISPHLLLASTQRQKVEVAFFFQTIDTPFGKNVKKSEVNQKEFVQGKEWAVYCIDFDTPRKLPLTGRTPGLTIKVVITFTDFQKPMTAEQKDESKSLLVGDMVKLYNERKYTDLAFVVEEKTIKVHRAILSSRSSVFTAMFEFNEEKRTIPINDVEFEVMDALIFYIYTGKVDFPEVDFAIKLFEAADKYDIKLLSLVCQDYVVYNITEDTVVRALIAGDLHNSKEMREACLKYTADHDQTRLADYAQLDSFPKILKDLAEVRDETKVDLLAEGFDRLAVGK